MQCSYKACCGRFSYKAAGDIIPTKLGLEGVPTGLVGMAYNSESCLLTTCTAHAMSTESLEKAFEKNMDETKVTEKRKQTKIECHILSTRLGAVRYRSARKGRRLQCQTQK